MYRFGTRSWEQLVGVHPKLVAACGIAIVRTKQDFGVFEGVRSLATQKEYVKRGVSWTLDSKHLVQKDGLGHAVDLVPWIGGAFRWDSEQAFVEIGTQMRRACEELGVKVTWGANVRFGGDWKKRNDMAHFEGEF